MSGYARRMARTAPALLVALLLAPGAAEAHVKRFAVPAGQTVEWRTPQRYAASDTVRITVWINGHKRRSHYSRYCVLGWVQRQVWVDADACGRRIVFSLANVRDRRVRVRVRYERAS